jgi:glycosyltransferase involved in cell wall biosynthesis
MAGVLVSPTVGAGRAAGRPRMTVVSTFAPRRCGLASYAEDLCRGLAVAEPDWRVRVCAIDRDALTYSPPVSWVIAQDEEGDYRRAADAIVDAGCDLVLIEHEFGIFGGPDGAYVLALADRLAALGVPYVVTLHTVLSSYLPGQARVLRALCGRAARVTVFTESARGLLAAPGIMAPDRIVLVPHGAPPVLRAPVDPAELRPEVAEALAESGPPGAIVLSTFGLLGPGKGLEVAVAALPELLSRHPEVRYVIAGATHPNEVRCNGERYRDSLRAVAERHGVSELVRFVDAFLTEAEVAALLARTDVYLTPYRSTEQICSGALTFALAAGCPVVSTAYRYARDLLEARDGAEVPGVLVPCDDPAALAAGIGRLLDDPAALARARRAADALGATLVWPAVAGRLAATLAPLVKPVSTRPARGAPSHERRAGAPPGRPGRSGPRGAMAGGASGPHTWVPPLRLDHLRRLTDATGIVQFARGDRPDLSSGYCVDDVARLGLVAAGLFERYPGPVRGCAGDWLATALAFIDAAMNPAGLYNVRGPDGEWRDSPHLGDHVGRAVWALSDIAIRDVPGVARGRAHDLLGGLLPLVARLEHARSTAYAVLGLARLSAAGDGRLATPVLRAAADRLAAFDAGVAGWCWYEPRLTYDNARLAHALLVAGEALGEAAMVRRGRSTLDWYLDQVGLAGAGPMLRCVGNDWRDPDGGGQADEQPLDAAATVEVLAAAWRITGDRRYTQLARRAHAWFYGANRAGVWLYDLDSGGCHDGFGAAGANLNMGAESTLAYYQSLLAVTTVGPVAARRHGAAVHRSGTGGLAVEGQAG